MKTNHLSLMERSGLDFFYELTFRKWQNKSSIVDAREIIDRQ
jgi:hypothetical protein